MNDRHVGGGVFLHSIDHNKLFMFERFANVKSKTSIVQVNKAMRELYLVKAVRSCLSYHICRSCCMDRKTLQLLHMIRRPLIMFK